MTTVRKLLDIIRDKPDDMPIRFKWTNYDFEWNCDGIMFCNTDEVINRYEGICFLFLADSHNEDWWVNCGNLKNDLITALNNGDTFENSIVGYSSTEGENQILIEDKKDHILIVMLPTEINCFK